MKKPNNYNETQAAGEFTPVELGGHKLIIKQVEEQTSRSGKTMLVVYFDFAADDKQPGYFTKQFRDDIRPDKKWPNQATSYVLLEDDQGNCSRSFKTFCSCVEHSNAGFQCWNMDDIFDFSGIKNKHIGGVFGPQMDYYNGRESQKRVLRWFISVDKIAEASIPEMSETQAYKAYKNNQGVNPASPGNGWMDIPDGDEELPFN